MLTRLAIVVILFTLIISCYKEQQANSVKITIPATSSHNQIIKISTTNMLTFEPVQLVEDTILPTDAPVIEFTLLDPAMAYLQIGEITQPVYLAPGYDLQVHIDTAADNAISFKGTGSEANTYLLQAASIGRKFEKAGGKSFFDLQPKDFLARLDSLTKALQDFHQQYTTQQKATLSENVSSFFENKNKIYVLQLKQNYALMRYNGASEETLVPAEFKHIIDEIPLDSVLLNAGMFEYALLLHMYMETRFYTPAWAGSHPQNRDSIRLHLPEIVHNQILEGDFSAAIKEFFIAKNIEIISRDQGMTPALDSIYTDFKKEYSQSAFLPSLQKSYDNWLSISPGTVAPDISGTTAEGKPISLSQFKGKVIYVDVWATWCGPCKEEVPFANKLQKNFEGNNQVVFLNVSIDENQQAWKKMVESRNEMKGIHMIEQPQTTKTSLTEAYMISSIPRYILIDSNGKVANAYAPRPSSGIVAAEIKNLLSQQAGTL